MAKIIQDIIPFGYGTGLNYDDDITLMQKGDSKKRLNISIDDQYHNGAIVRALGNVALNNILDVESNDPWVSTDLPGEIPPVVRYDKDINSSRLSFYQGIGTENSVVVISIVTDTGNYRVYSKANNFTSVQNACDSIISKILGLGDPNIINAAYVINGTITNFTIDIINSRETQIIKSMVSSHSPGGVISTLVSGRDIVGQYYHEKDNELYMFFAYNSSALPSSNLILRYNHNENLTEILNSSELDIPYTIATWNKLVPIRAVVVGDDQAKTLYWTDGINFQMNLNINRALNTAYDYPGDIYSNHQTSELRKLSLNLIKYQPAYPITNTITGGPDFVGTNILVAKIPPQFACRYVYADNEKSRWSVISYLNLHNKERAVGILGPNMKIVIYDYEITPPQSTSIRKVEFAYRNLLSDHWKLFDRKDFSGTGSVGGLFLGTEPTEIIDDIEANTLFDNVPIRSGAITSLNDNRLLLADNTVGYPNVAVDVDIVPVTHVTSVMPTSVLWMASATINSTTQDFFVSQTAFGLGDGLIYMIFRTTFSESIIQYEAEGASNTVRANFFVNYINTKIVGVDPRVTGASNVSNNVRVTFTSGGFTYGKTSLFVDYQKTMKLKNGINHYLGIVYFDESGRRGFVNKIKEEGTYVNFYTQQSVITNNEYSNALKLTISSRPPVWAHSWGIYYGDNTPYYIQLVLKVADFNRDLSGILRVKVDQILNSIKEFNPAFNLSYQFTPGDRMRFIGSVIDVANGSVNYKRTSLFGEYIDVEILGLSGEFNEYVSIPNISSSAVNAASYVLVEIYSPKNNDQPAFYFETPYKFPVLNPGTIDAYHGITGQSAGFGVTPSNQDATNPAVCYFAEIDFGIAQNWAFDQGEPIASFVDSLSFSNYFNSRITNIGKPHIVNQDARQIRLNTVQWSNIYIPRTRVNGLSSFEFDSEKAFDDKYGRITGIEVIGDILNVVQEAKISTVYLQSEVAIDADGNQIRSFSPNVIGSIRPGAEPYGSQDKYSQVKCGNYIYGFDLQSGVPWRKSFNGVEDLSKYKMRNYFRIKAKTLIASGRGNVMVHCGYDFYKQILYVTFLDFINSANNETLAFHEPTNRWISFYSFIPDMYASIENIQFLSIKDGGIYIHDSYDIERGSFYGTIYGSEVWAVGNIYPDQPKTYNVISENSNVVWSMPDNDSIVVDEDSIDYENQVDNTVFKGVMYSRLKEQRFRNRGTKFVASFMNDISFTTGEYGTPTNRLFNARKLNGRTIICKLKNSTNAEVILRSVTIGSSI